MEKYTEWKKKIEKIISQVEGNVCINFYDLNKNNGFSVNGDKKVLSASMIKLLILAELMKKIFENRRRWSFKRIKYWTSFYFKRTCHTYDYCK